MVGRNHQCRGDGSRGRLSALVSRSGPGALQGVFESVGGENRVRDWFDGIECSPGEPGS